MRYRVCEVKHIGKYEDLRYYTLYQTNVYEDAVKRYGNLVDEMMTKPVNRCFCIWDTSDDTIPDAINCPPYYLD